MKAMWYDVNLNKQIHSEEVMEGKLYSPNSIVLFDRKLYKITAIDVSHVGNLIIECLRIG